MRQLTPKILALLAIVVLATSSEAISLSDALKNGNAVKAITTEEVAVRDAPPKQGFLVVDTGKKLLELQANTVVTIAEQMELKTLIGPFIYVKITLKNPQTGQNITGWAWYGDTKKSQFKLLP